MFLCAVVSILLLGLSASSVSAGTRPGFQTRVTQHALNYANQKAIDALAEKVPSAKIRDQSGSNGDMSYDLKNIRISGFRKPSSSIKLVPNKGLTWAASNAGVSIHSDWSVRYRLGWIKMSTSGSVDVSASGVSFSVMMLFSTDPTGRPAVRSGGCRSSIGSVNVKFHGDLAFLLNLFRGVVENKVKDMLPGKLCDAVNELVNTNAEKALKKVKVRSPLIDHQFMLDYRLVASPAFQTEYMETYHKGEITWTADQNPPPFSPVPLPPYHVSTRMLYLWVGAYVPQSFVYAAQRHGFLKYNMTTKDLPPGEKGFLNTTCPPGVATCVGYIFPPVGKKYPGHTVTLRMNSTMTPVINMAPNLLESRMGGEIALYVDTPSGPAPYLLTLGVSAVFNMTATINDQMITGSITGHSFKVKVLDSAVGPIKEKPVNVLVSLAMNLFIIPKLNEAGMKGFPLPVTHNVQFLNTELEIQQNALMIATDLKYHFDF